MAKAKNNWQIDKERLVFYSDFMGFKDRVQRTKHEDLKKDLQGFNEKLRKLNPLKTGDHLRMLQFSDSIIIASDKADCSSLNLITKAAVSVMQLALERSLPIKGCIAKGPLTMDISDNSQLCFGQALIDAYLLEEDICFYGVVVHHTAEHLVKENLKKQPYHKANISLKSSGKSNHYQLSWWRLDKMLKAGNIKDTARNWIEKNSETVSGSPRRYIDNTIAVIEEIEKSSLMSLQ